MPVPSWSKSFFLLIHLPQTLAPMIALDDVDDVQEIYTNMSVSDEVAAELAED